MQNYNMSRLKARRSSGQSAETAEGAISFSPVKQNFISSIKIENSPQRQEMANVNRDSYISELNECRQVIRQNKQKLFELRHREQQLIG